jgi:hypothetical protein
LAEPARVTLFSDGSLIDGKVGAAGLLCVDGVVKRVKGVRLGSATRYGVYEAEGVGQVLALECLRQEMDEQVEGNVPLGLDNTAAITATTSPKPGVGRYIWDIFHRRLTATRQKHPNMRLRVDWTPGHVDIPGNEAADVAAKRAAQSGSFGGTPKVLKKLPYSRSALALAHTRLLKSAAEKNWKRSNRTVEPVCESKICNDSARMAVKLLLDRYVGSVRSFPPRLAYARVCLCLYFCE